MSTVTHEVTHDDTAKARGSGDLEILSTPRLLAWMEAATLEAVAPLLPADRTSVGTAVRMRHRRPTPVGGTVSTNAELTSGPDEKGRVSFTVTAHDAAGELIGQAEIDRVLVDPQTFGR